MRTFTIVLIFTILTSFSFSQNTSELQKKSGRINTFYVEGYSDKAEYLQTLLEDAANYYENILNDTFSLDLYVIDRKNWKTYSDTPYPIADCQYKKNRIIIPVFSFSKIYLTDNNTLYSKNYIYLSDFVVVRELGHYIANKEDAKSSSKWLAEFFADYILMNYLLEKVPGYQYNNTMAKIFIYLPLKYKSTFRYDKAGNFSKIFYHPKFQELAYKIHQKYGSDFIKDYIAEKSQLNKDIEVGKSNNTKVIKKEIYKHSIEYVKSITEPEIIDKWNKTMRQSFRSWIIILSLFIIIVIVRFTNSSVTVFMAHNKKLKGIEKILGITAIKIWKNLKEFETKEAKRKLVFISILRILNSILVLLLLFAIFILLFNV